MMNSMTIKESRNRIDEDFEHFLNYTEENSRETLNAVGEILVTYARANFTRRADTGKGFQTRTGRLAASLFADVEAEGDELVLQFGANMDYAAAVEEMRSGRFAYLGPTLAAVAPRITEMFRKRMGVGP